MLNQPGSRTGGRILVNVKRRGVLTQVNLAKGGQRGVGSMGGHRKLKRLSSSLDHPTVSQRVMQILKENKAAYKRGGKNGFNVEEYVSKQKIRCAPSRTPTALLRVYSCMSIHPSCTQRAQ